MTKQASTKYRIRNWSEYNKTLVNRGSLTVWFSEEFIEKWHTEPSRGRLKVYLDDAILCTSYFLMRFRPK